MDSRANASRIKADTIVIGAGPAGLGAALALGDSAVVLADAGEALLAIVHRIDDDEIFFVRNAVLDLAQVHIFPPS